MQIVLDIGRVEDGNDPGNRKRLAHLDRFDQRMRVIAAAEGDEQCAGRGDVIHEAACPSQQARILEPFDALPDQFRTQFNVHRHA